jgi:hypothetical protein
VQRDAIVSPISGETIYQTDDNNIYFYNGTAWQTIQDATLQEAYDFGDGTLITSAPAKPLYLDGINISGFTSNILSIDVTDSALRLSRLDNTQRNALTPSAGQLFYNTSSNVLEYRNNTAWKSIVANFSIATLESLTIEGSGPLLVTLDDTDGLFVSDDPFTRGARYTYDRITADVDFRIDSPTTLFGSVGNTSVEINQTGPSYLKFTNTTGSLVLNNVTSVQRDAFVAPEAGTVIWNTAGEFEIYAGVGWVSVLKNGDSAVFSDIEVSQTGPQFVEIDGTIGVQVSNNPAAPTRKVNILNDKITSLIDLEIDTPILKLGNQNRLQVNQAGPSYVKINGVGGGLVLSRLTTPERDSLVNPEEGMIIYNTDGVTEQLEYRDSNGWVRIPRGQADADFTGLTIDPLAGLTTVIDGAGVQVSDDPVTATTFYTQDDLTSTAATYTISAPIININPGTTLQYAGGNFFDAISDIASKGDLIVGDGVNSSQRLAVGGDGDLIVADSTTATGLKYSSVATEGLSKNIVTKIDTTTVSNTVTTTDTLGTIVGSNVIPANSMVQGTDFKIIAGGELRTNGVGQTILIEVRFNGDIVAETQIIQLENITTLEFFELEIDSLTIRQAGGSGVAQSIATGEFKYRDSTPNNVLRSHTMRVLNTDLDTTVANTIAITVTWGAASANNLINFETLSIERTR